MATNRMTELQDMGGGYRGGDIESGGGGDYLDEIGHIKEQIKQIQENTGEINALKKEQAWNDDGESADARLDGLLNETNSLVQDVRKKLQRLNKENKAMDKSDSSYRQRTTVLGATVNSFQDVLRKYESAQEGYRDNYKSRVRRQARIVDPDISDQQVETLFEKGPQQTFSAAILDEQRHNEAKNALIFIQEQHRDIQKLEQSIVELHQLFIDMAALVDAQQDVLTSVQKNIDQAKQASGESLRHLQEGERSAISSRKKCCIICIIICVVLLVIAGIIAAIVGVVVLIG